MPEIEGSSEREWNAAVTVDAARGRVILENGVGRGGRVDFTPQGAECFARGIRLLKELCETEGAPGFIVLLGNNLVVMKAQRAETVATLLTEAAMLARPISRGSVS